MKNGKKIGLSLSGGGYRAAAFHLGTLRKLDQLKILPQIDVLSTISGGSITGACYSLTSLDFNSFDNWMTETLSKKSVVRYVLLSPRSIPAWILVLLLLASLIILPFNAYAWTSVFIASFIVILILLFQFKIFPVSSIIEEAYDKFFYHKATLSGLGSTPLLVIGSTNIQTCRQFSFSKYKMEDSTYSYANPPIKFKHADFPISRAVMASSCVPFAFSPIGIDQQFFPPDVDATKINPQLVDGGVYDNQGIHRLTQKGYYECEIIMTSDAGNKLPFVKSYNNAFVLILRTVDVFMQRIKNFQMMQNLYFNTRTVNKEITYLSLGWDLKNCISGFVDNLAGKNIIASVIAAHQLPDNWVNDVENNRAAIETHLAANVKYAAIKANDLSEAELSIARKVGTNLTKLTRQEVDLLARHAANLTELQVRLYCPSLI